ncbi:MAG: hypothetical protein ACYC1Z_03350 [Georgenia sp.]
MALIYPLFVHPDMTGVDPGTGQPAPRGTTALEARKALAGLVPSAGVIDGMVASGTTGWQYSVGAGHYAVEHAEGGVSLGANDGPLLVPTDPAPQTGSRIDVIWVMHKDAVTDADSAPLVGVTQGPASGTPQVPAIPAGAVELNRAVVPAGAPDTLGATITRTGKRPGVTATVTPAAGYAGALIVERGGDGRVTNGGALGPTASPTITSTYVTIGTIPEGFRPQQTMLVSVVSSVDAVFQGQITPAGAIQVRTFKVGGQAVNTNTSFSIAGLTWIAGV